MPKINDRAIFPDARMLNDGGFTTPQGNLVQSNYVDLSGALPLGGFSLAKASEPRFDLRKTGTVRLSRPAVFRTTGEVLVRDSQEGEVRTMTRETVEESDEQVDLDRRTRVLSAAMRLSHTKMSVTTKAKAGRTNTATANITFGNDWLIYCTSILPEPGKKEARWRRTFPDGYTSVAQIYRPTQFAHALGLAICEHVGATGKPGPTSGTFYGFRTVEVERIPQIIVHGPVLYVDDPYRCIEEAEGGWAQICSMIFVKSQAYAAQKEYRFAAISIRPEVGDVVDLPVSGMMRDCLEPMNTRLVTADQQVKITVDETETQEKYKTSQKYTYRRRTVKRQTGNWGGDEETEGREREEILEETVTSPDEVPDPFPSEVKEPDVIVFHQFGSRYRFVHNGYWNQETERWRIETLRENPEIVKNPRLGRLPDELGVPENVRFDSLVEHPLHPEFVLDLCLNPSIPKPPLEYSPLKRFSPSEVGHVMACHQSLGMAVDLLKGVDQEWAAASVWYAFKFVLDLVSRFGAIVKSVCVIRECVAVVELKRATFSGAVAWATFSGTGTYTLYVDQGNVEELVFSGRFSRARPMSESTVVDLLRDNGWGLKDPA